MNDQDWNQSPPASGGPVAPGEPPPGAPPPGPPPGALAPPLPWEDRERVGFVNGLLETIKLLITAPGSAYRRAKEKGDYFGPLLFAVLIGWVMAIIGQLWSLLFQSTWISMMPAEMRREIGPMMAGGAAGFVVTIILAPIIITIVLFIWSAIVHLFLNLVGGTSASTAGYEGTFRAISYAQVASLAQIVPIVGGLIAFVWAIVLQVIGLSTLHKTTGGKAAAGVLIPIVLCCICVIAVLVLFVGSLAAIFSGQMGN